MLPMKLTDYGISMKTGFVHEDPLERLPIYFEPWNKLVFDLPTLFEKKQLRQEILQLPVLSTDRLACGREINLAHLELVALTAGYLWQNGTDEGQVPKVLPKSLAIPLWDLYEKHGLPPVVTHISFILSNLKPTSSDGEITSIVRAPGGKVWTNFFAVALQTELDFAASIQALQDVLDGIDIKDEEKISRSLETMTVAVQKMTKTMSKFHDVLRPEDFFTHIATFFSGYSHGPLKEGLIFDGVRDEPVKMPNSNAGQSPIFHSLDALLGIEHKSDRHKHGQAALAQMYPHHRTFVDDLRRRPVQLKEIVDSCSSVELRSMYNKLVEATSDFRSYHIRIVTKYILIPSRKLLTVERQEEIKPANDVAVQFLKGSRDDCKAASLTSPTPFKNK